MIDLPALRSLRFGLAFTFVVGAVLCSDRLFGVQGQESALVLGALVPPWAATISVRVVDRARKLNAAPPATGLLWRALLGGWLLLAAPTALLALNALRVRNCTPFEGALFMVLGPFSGTTLASTWGLLMGALTPRVRVATALALLGPIGSIAIALAHFHATPAIFAYGHFFGFFPGTLYDEALQIPTPLLTMRAVTLALAVALGCLWIGHYDSVARRLRFHPQASILYGLTAMLGLGIAFAAEIDGKALGHRTSVEWISLRLGRSLDGQRCRVVVPRELAKGEALRLRDDCDFRVGQMERVIGVTQRARVTAFFFRSPDEKRALMGAGTTSIAKPWRNEVYLQLNGWPHPSLAHEIAHVVAGNVAPGPFHVAARLGGLWPEASLIEGMAVASAWDADNGMTPHQWARAMVDLGLSPRVSDLLGTGFLGQPKERAYTLAGSFLRFIGETRGAPAVRSIYRAGNVETIGASLEALEQQWLTFIRSVPLPAEARALAAHRFARGSIFSTVCPHAVANLRLAAQGDLAANDLPAALNTCRTLLGVDPTDAWARTTLVSTLARAGRVTDAAHELEALARPPAAAKPNISTAKHAIADAAWRGNALSEARRMYRELLNDAQSEDVSRLLEVKLLALDGDERQRALLFALLVGDDGSAPDPATAVHSARELSAMRLDGLGTYLEARQLFIAQRYALSARLMQQALRADLPTKSLRTAALRVEAISRFAVAELAAAEHLWNSVAELGGDAHSVEAIDWHERIRWAGRREREGRLSP